MRKIKTGDKVKIMRGKDAGKESQVLKVITTLNKRGKEVTKVVVKDVNKMKKHQKPVPALNLPGGIIEIEKPIDVSNAMVIDPKDGKPTRVGFKVDEKTGKKYRFAKKSGTKLDK